MVNELFITIEISKPGPFGSGFFVDALRLFSRSKLHQSISLFSKGRLDLLYGIQKTWEEWITGERAFIWKLDHLR